LETAVAELIQAGSPK